MRSSTKSTSSSKKPSRFSGKTDISAKISFIVQTQAENKDFPLAPALIPPLSPILVVNTGVMLCRTRVEQ